MKYWLMKSEPDTFGIDHLAKRPQRTSGWDGVRNYQARNMLRDEFAVGDRAFFHHSSCETPGIYGTIEVVRAGHPDPSQFDRKSKYYDAASTRENPRWVSVDVRFVAKTRLVTLEELRRHKTLGKMRVLQRGNRLSITPVEAAEWKHIMEIVNRK